jgi:small subunit ribosomal protein S20
MPNIQSAKKRARQTEKRRLRNRYQFVTTRNVIKKLYKTKDATTASQLLNDVISRLDKLAKNNIIHKNKAGNQKSAVVLHVNRLAAK